MTTDPKPEKSFGSQVSNIFRILLRLMFTIILAIGIGVGLYYGIAYGIPAFRNQYIQPVSDNSQRLDKIEIRQAQQLDQLTGHLDKLQERLESLEMQNDTNKDTFTGLQTQIAAVSDDLQSLKPTVQGYATYTSDLYDNFQEAILEIESRELQIQDVLKDLAAEQIPVAALQNELTLVKAMELLTRTQQSLLHNNFGLAKDDLQAALGLLRALQSEVSDAQTDRLSTIIQHMEAALEHLPNSPNLASTELEIAWHILILDESETAANTPQVTPTPTPTP